MATLEEINALFKKWEEISEYRPNMKNIPENTPVYTPTPRDAGPKALTIEQYKKRQGIKIAEPPNPPKQIKK